MRRAIFWPVAAHIALVAVIWVRLYLARLAEMRARRIDPQSLVTSQMAAKALENVSAADNFRNLFEVPVLFYVVCCALAITDLVTPLQMSLAWGYVALRVAHSLIHVTYNRVTHRFVVYEYLGRVCHVGCFHSVAAAGQRKLNLLPAAVAGAHGLVGWDPRDSFCGVPAGRSCALRMR